MENILCHLLYSCIITTTKQHQQYLCEAFVDICVTLYHQHTWRKSGERSDNKCLFSLADFMAI